MIIPGIPDDQLERNHCYKGPSKGGECALKHLPSGIIAGGPKPPEMTIHQFNRQLIAELTMKLKAAGIITGMETHSE
jgi:hypothetical protein